MYDHRPARRPARQHHAADIAKVVGLLVVIAIIIATAVYLHGRNTARCKDMGGHVVTDTERYRTKDGTWKTKTEHECISADGRELYEW